MTKRCGEPFGFYPPCHLKEGHEGSCEHLDGRCQVGLMHHLAVYYANDPNKGVRWKQCELLAGHLEQHEVRTEITRVSRF